MQPLGPTEGPSIVQSEPPSPVASTSALPADEELAPALSKNARKKRARKEAQLAARPAKRAAERARKKERKAEQRAAGITVPGKRKAPEEQVKWAGTLALDCSFDDKMLEKDIASLMSQVKYCYSENRVAKVLPSIVCTSFNGQLKQRFNDKNADYTSWNAKYIRFAADDLQSLWEGQGAEHAKKDMVYLTADSPHTLSTLEEGKCYILGAIVDHNKYKNLCLDRANELGIAHAALPIGEYVSEMQTRRVLTVNQVVEIMLAYLETTDWEAAFRKAIPQRKFAKPEPDKQSNTPLAADGSESSEETETPKDGV